MAARNEGYIPSWADDVLAFVAGFGVRARGPKAVHIPGDRHLRERPMLERLQTELAEEFTVRDVLGTEDDALDLINGFIIIRNGRRGCETVLGSLASWLRLAPSADISTRTRTLTIMFQNGPFITGKNTMCRRPMTRSRSLLRLV